MKIYFLFFFLIGITLNSYSQSRVGKDRALFFAVNDYAQMTDLNNPIQNARDIAAELKQRYGFEPDIVENPTFAQIESKIKEYQRAYRSGRFAQDGQLFIFFSGHGELRGRSGYFMPTDADPNRPFATAMDYNYWRSEINSIDCKHILVAIDACHSVAFNPKWDGKNGSRFHRPGEQYADQTLLNYEQYRARLFFTSDAVGDQTPDRSTFARQLLEGLRTHRTASAYLTSSELSAIYLQKAKPIPGGGDFGDDEPGSCFLFFTQPSTDPVDAQADRNAWQQARQANTAAAYRHYLLDFPSGEFRPLAQQQLNLREAEERELYAWEVAKSTHTSKSYQDFIDAYPTSIYRELAELNRDQLSPNRPPDNMVLVKGGSFQMGSNDSDSEKPVHLVSLSDYYIGRFELTFDEYDAFCTATNQDLPDDEGWGRGKRPVINISWLDAVAYCNWLSGQHRYQPVYTINGNSVSADWNANGYRLPTEAEWEYAARSRGGNEKWAGTSAENELTNYANGSEGDGFKYTAPVGSLRANDHGLHDMSGNVYEWCWDRYGSYSSTVQNHPKGPDTGSARVFRGGSWYNSPARLRCASRNLFSPDYRNRNIGFRLSRAGR